MSEFHLSKTAKAIIKQCKASGYVGVSAYEPLHWKRRNLLLRMEDAGLLKQIVPQIGSYIYYNAIDTAESSVTIGTPTKELPSCQKLKPTPAQHLTFWFRMLFLIVW